MKDDIVTIPFVAHESAMNRMERANKRLWIVILVMFISFMVYLLLPNEIIDEIFRDRLDEKDDKIADLQRQLTTATQNAYISNSLNNEIDLMYNRLVNCPIPSTPVYGRTAIFSCPQNNGCGCGFNTTSQFI